MRFGVEWRIFQARLDCAALLGDTLSANLVVISARADGAGRAVRVSPVSCLHGLDSFHVVRGAEFASN